MMTSNGTLLNCTHSRVWDYLYFAMHTRFLNKNNVQCWFNPLRLFVHFSHTGNRTKLYYYISVRLCEGCRW